ncbi:PREDICTED: uncharacterized protein LOC106790796 [Polistes canadensis]|uniref:uncharacterized protein LOC106790796 n=1 Tax=Polistes canadensis TaxID=91411 RepID=UPI000718FBCF|nr:PREDICTED: uncharacterized protein LOC106790796 [Polistes canadensis]
MEGTIQKPPLVTNFISVVLSQTFNAQLSSACADFELRAVECYESYGLHRATSQQLCKDYMDDLQECLFKTKTALRYIEMQNERERQYKAGLRKEQFAPPPDQDHE